MSQDYARKRGKNARGGKKKRPAGKAANKGSSAVTWFFSGVLCGVLLCALVWLATLPAEPGTQPAVAASGNPVAPAAEDTRREPDFTFYEMLPEQRVEVGVDPAEVASARSEGSTSQFLLQAGSFRQQEDAERRRAELIMLNLDPRIQESSGDNGRWYRVFIGPFDSRSKLQKARSITAQEGIETLMVKRPGA